MRGGSGPRDRFVVLRDGASVIATGGEYDADLCVGYRTVTFELPHGAGTLELRVESEVAALLIAALAGPGTVLPRVTPEIAAAVRDRAREAMAKLVAEQPSPTRLFTVKGDEFFGDVVIEVPADITTPADVESFLAGRLADLTWPRIDAEYISWLVHLRKDHADAVEAFASLSIDGGRRVRYPLIEAPRGGAR